MINTNDVSIIIVTRNGWEVTKNCLKSLRSVNFLEVILVDNDSTDETLLELKKWKDYPIKLIKNKENTGFAPANNQGLKQARGKYVLFLNNDTIVNKDFLPELIKSLKNNLQAAAVQPMILFPDGTIDSIGSYLTPTGFLYHRAHRLKPKKTFLINEPVYSLKGACMLWKREVLQQIGGFTDSFFAYFEETELCHRAINSGYQVLINPNTSITHLGGFTSNKMDKPFVQYHNAKNRITTYIKHLPILKLIPILIIHLLLCELMVIKIMLKDINIALAIQKGLIVGILNGWEERKQWTGKRIMNIPEKNPDLNYYLALFSSLKNYRKIW